MDSKFHKVADVAASAGQKRKREGESKVSTSVRKSKAFIGENDQADAAEALSPYNGVVVIQRGCECVLCCTLRAEGRC